MNSLRNFLKESPWAGWLVALLLLGAAVWIYFARTGSTDPYNPDRMREMVSIKFTDTGDVIEMPRGRLDKELRGRGDTVNSAQGIMNPKTGQPTGFLFDKTEWDQMIQRINSEKETIRKTSGKTVAPAPRAATAPPTPPAAQPPK